MRPSEWRTLWLPVVLCVLVADLNFWYWASTGENDFDYAGILLFLIFAVLWFKAFLQSRRPRDLVSGIGAILSLVLMALRETGTWDRGYVPPYIVFIAFVIFASKLAASA